MSTELSKSYTPADVQSEVAAAWEAKNAFHAEPTDPGEPYAIVIPPPNVTAALHLGHALNNALQDILIRKARMEGKNAVWLPGTDHAGIATQTVVEKRVLREEGKRRTDFDRDEFVGKIQAWKDEYEKIILGQLKTMGCSCDWQRTAFTMDDSRAKAVREAFFQLFKAGLIYRGKRLVNWDPVTQTALADDEVDNEEVDGFFYYLKYPLSDGSGSVTVATTRPETMLGDTAVAINPTDPRAAALKGKFVKLPIVNRVIPIIEDEYVVKPVQYGGDPADTKAQMATGFLKVTPAHDPNDYDIGQRHKLPIVNIMAPDASISDKHGWTDIGDAGFLLGKSREEARKLVVKWFKDNGLLEDQKPYKHSVGHSYRSHVAIEPYLSDQWYCKVTDDRLKGAALRAMNPSQRTTSSPLPLGERQGEGASSNRAASSPQSPSPQPSPKGRGSEDLTFYPERYAKNYQHWHENIRDWCISRQLWWGHRIPVWSKTIDVVAEKRNYRDAIAPLIVDLNSFQDDCTATIIVNSSTGQICTAKAFEDKFEGHRPENDGKYQVHVCLREPVVNFAGDKLDGADILTRMGFLQDPDVLDTWFSSALWPMSTLGWPSDVGAASAAHVGGALGKWNPTSVLCTAREIITLWVSRMVMFNEFFLGQVPFKDVFVHAMIQDGHGQKMSKSLGNGVDPLDIIETHGTDAMRFTLCSMTTQTQDVRMPVDCLDPATNEPVTPKTITNSAGYTVAAPVQEYKGKKFASSYGAITGEAPADLPVAKNTSSKFDGGRNFCNKIWNAARFVLMQIAQSSSPLPPGEGQGEGASSNQAAPSPQSPSPQPSPEGRGSQSDAPLSIADLWIMSRFNRSVAEANEAMKDYRFDQYARVCYDFVWRDFCDWYVEAAKPQMKNPATKAQTAQILASVLDGALRLLHPIMPFITEKIWWKLNETYPNRGVPGRIDCPQNAPLLIKAPFPAVGDFSEAAEFIFPKIQEIITAIRTLRNDYKIEPRKSVTVSIKVAGDAGRQIMALKDAVELLAVCKLQTVGADVAEPANSAKAMAVGCEIFVEGLVDQAAEAQRGEKRKEEVTKQLAALKGRLSNPGYVAKAPPKLVQETQAKIAELEAELAKLG